MNVACAWNTDFVLKNLRLNKLTLGQYSVAECNGRGMAVIAKRSAFAVIDVNSTDDRRRFGRQVQIQGMAQTWLGPALNTGFRGSN